MSAPNGTSAGECLKSLWNTPSAIALPAPEPTKIEVAAAMQSTGGGFVKALAACVLRADPGNLEIIKAAWPHYWAQYAGLASMKKTQPAA